MKVNNIPPVTKIVEIEPAKYSIEFTFEELKCLVDDVNTGKGLDWHSPAGVMSNRIWSELARITGRL